jgi:hypothetical protein
MKKALILATAALMIGNVFATQDPTKKLPIDGTGEVKPNHTLAVSLAPLKDNVDYNITCLINNSFTQNISMRFSYQTSGGPSAYKFILNQKILDNGQGEVLQKDNNILLGRTQFDIYANSKLIFDNLDNDESVFVHDCKAVPVVPSIK